MVLTPPGNFRVEWYDVDGLDALPDVAWQQAYVIGHSLVEPNTLNDRICYGNVGERIVAMVQGDFEA